MKIVQLLTQWETGGAQVRALKMAEALRSRGHEVQTWFLYRKGELVGDYHGLHIFRENRPTGLAALRTFVDVYRRLRQHSPDAVISYTQYANVFGQWIACLAGRPIRVAAQTQMPADVPLVPRLLDRFNGTAGVYTSVVANSQATANAFADYSRSYRDRLHIVYNCAEIPAPSRARAEVRVALGIGETARLIVSTGRLAPQKNHETTLRAVASLPADVHLCIIGAGAARARLEGLVCELGIENRVQLLGEVSQQALSDIYSAADAFVLLSRFETFGVAVAEAASLRLPLVCADLPVLREVLQPAIDAGVGVEFVCSEDSESAAAAIDRATIVPAVAPLCARSIDRHDAYSVQSMTSGYAELLQEPG